LEQDLAYAFGVTPDLIHVDDVEPTAQTGIIDIFFELRGVAGQSFDDLLSQLSQLQLQVETPFSPLLSGQITGHTNTEFDPIALNAPEQDSSSPPPKPYYSIAIAIGGLIIVLLVCWWCRRRQLAQQRAAAKEIAAKNAASSNAHSSQPGQTGGAKRGSQTEMMGMA